MVVRNIFLFKNISEGVNEIYGGEEGQKKETTKDPGARDDDRCLHLHARLFFPDDPPHLAASGSVGISNQRSQKKKKRLLSVSRMKRKKRS